MTCFCDFFCNAQIYTKRIELNDLLYLSITVGKTPYHSQLAHMYDSPSGQGRRSIFLSRWLGINCKSTGEYATMVVGGR